MKKLKVIYIKNGVKYSAILANAGKNQFQLDLLKRGVGLSQVLSSTAF